jgi:hypothetical protein
MYLPYHKENNMKYADLMRLPITLDSQHDEVLKQLQPSNFVQYLDPFGVMKQTTVGEVWTWGRVGERPVMYPNNPKSEFWIEGIHRFIELETAYQKEKYTQRDILIALFGYGLSNNNKPRIIVIRDKTSEHDQKVVVFADRDCEIFDITLLTNGMSIETLTPAGVDVVNLMDVIVDVMNNPADYSIARKEIIHALSTILREAKLENV